MHTKHLHSSESEDGTLRGDQCLLPSFPSDIVDCGKRTRIPSPLDLIRECFVELFCGHEMKMWLENSIDLLLIKGTGHELWIRSAASLWLFAFWCNEMFLGSLLWRGDNAPPLFLSQQFCCVLFT